MMSEQKEQKEELEGSEDQIVSRVRPPMMERQTTTYFDTKSPSEIYKELGPTALFLRTTTARKAAVLAASKKAKEEEEENARQAAEARKRHKKLMLQEASLAGTFNVRPTLPRLQSGRSEWEGFLARESVLGLSFEDLLEDGLNNAELLASHATRDSTAREKVKELNKRFFKSKKVVLSFEALQNTTPEYDTDYRELFGQLPERKIKKLISAFKPRLLNSHSTLTASCNGNSDRELLRREAIKHSDRVRALITLFWLAADIDQSNIITRDKYLLLNRKLQIAILGLYDSGYGRELAERDWELDKSENGVLNFETLFCSFFLLADMFANEVTEEAYCSFLGTIAQRMLKLDKETQSYLVFRRDSRIIPRKTFEYIKSHHSDWLAFMLPTTSRSCRKKYGQSSFQVEDVTDCDMIEQEALDEMPCEEKERDEAAGSLKGSLTRGLEQRRRANRKEIET